MALRCICRVLASNRVEMKKDLGARIQKHEMLYTRLYDGVGVCGLGLCDY